ILCTLHAGGKFSDRNYQFSGGLHGVGVSVVNALSLELEVRVRRDGNLHRMLFRNGEKASALEIIDSVPKRQTGTTVRFRPDPRYFDTVKFSVSRLTHLLRAKAVLCPGLRIVFSDEGAGTREEWYYEAGLPDYMRAATAGSTTLPADPFVGSFSGSTEAVDWAVQWLPDGGELVTESYVNLIPTPQGGTHVNGLRAGLLEALREYCEFRNLLPRGIKLAPEDLWDRCAYVLSAKLREPQFSGQTKERLSSREAASFIAGVARDAFGLWLGQHTEEGDRIAEMAVSAAGSRLRKSRQVERKKVTTGPALPGKLADCTAQDLDRTELFLVEGDSAGGSAKQARDRVFQAIMPLKGKILNAWELESGEILASEEIHNIAVALGVDPGSSDLEGLRYGKVCILADADSDGLHIATLLCALFVRHFRPLVEAGRVHVAMPPLYRIDVGNDVYYALDEAEKSGVMQRIEAEKKRGKVNVQRFKGLGEMNPMQLRETVMTPETRRLVELTLDAADGAEETLDMLLAKKRSTDRRDWLERSGNLAELA
ncbi:MAG: DNA topoisomerase IV subunit B, partial [Gammaproteobacteria bacterium]